MSNPIEQLRTLARNMSRQKEFDPGCSLICRYADEIERNYVELPKDADGEHIRVGERVQRIGNDPSTVSHMMLADDGWRVYVKYDGGIGTGSGEPKSIRHYHAPTVEDVMVEFATDWESAQDGEDKTAVLKLYATKLKLAEGDA